MFFFQTVNGEVEIDEVDGEEAMTKNAEEVDTGVVTGEITGGLTMNAEEVSLKKCSVKILKDCLNLELRYTIDFATK